MDTHQLAEQVGFDTGRTVRIRIDGLGDHGAKKLVTALKENSSLQVLQGTYTDPYTDPYI